MSTTTCLVLRPSEDEFRDFRGYVERIERDYPHIGMCKVIPPPSWFVRDYDSPEIDNIVVKTPIRQIVSGSQGVHQLQIVEDSDMTLAAFRAHCVVHSPQAVDETHTHSHAHAQTGTRRGRRTDSHTASETHTRSHTRGTHTDTHAHTHTEAHSYTHAHTNMTAVEERERRFWRSVVVSSSLWESAPLYGADLPGSLFTGAESHRAWNINALDNLLRALETEMPGVNSSMLYVGSWRAMFAFHCEDMDLFSINYLHTGAEKSWYCIQPKDRKRFENMAETHFAIERTQCSEYLRHKTVLFSPKQLKASCIPFEMAVQCAGEFIITFPGSYHGGFNHGFNIAEATNFALPSWLEKGRRARRCLCRPYSVSIDVDLVETHYLQERMRENRWERARVKMKERERQGKKERQGEKQLRTQRDIEKENQNKTLCEEEVYDVSDDSDSQPQQQREEEEEDDEEALYFVDEDLLCEGDESDGDLFAEEERYQRRVRCFCVVKSLPPLSHKHTTSSSHTHTPTDTESEAMRCRDCALWFHPLCVRQAYTTVYDLSFLSVPLCHVCDLIATKRQQKSAPSTEDNEEKKFETASKAVSSSSVRKRKRSLGVKAQDDATSEKFQKNDEVSVILSDAKIPTLGVLTDIDEEQQMGRLHVKNTKKSEDLWVKLSACIKLSSSSLLDPSPPGQDAPSQHKKKKQLERPKKQRRSAERNHVLLKKFLPPQGDNAHSKAEEEPPFLALPSNGDYFAEEEEEEDSLPQLGPQVCWPVDDLDDLDFASLPRIVTSK